jgi:ferredoxin-type protein NapH
MSMKFKIKAGRHLIQLIALAILFPPLYFTGVVWLGTYISADFMGIGLTDPLTALEVTLAGKTWWGTLWISALPLLLIAFVFGRVFCSYVCPLNFLLELLPVKRKKMLSGKTLPIAILGLVLMLSLILSVPVFNLTSPIFALMRVVLFGAGLEAALVLIVLAASLRWGQKIWCRTMCPLGALYGVLGTKRRLFLQVDANRCIHCGKCMTACTMGTRPGASGLDDAYLCTNCGDCVDACEKGAIRFTLRGPGDDVLKKGDYHETV